YGGGPRAAGTASGGGRQRQAAGRSGGIEGQWNAGGRCPRPVRCGVLDGLRKGGLTVKTLLVASLAVALTLGAVAARADAPPPGAPPAPPNKVALRAQLGIIYAQNGQRDEARQEFVKLMEEPQGRAAALTNLGNLSFLDGKVDDALES